MNPTKFRDDARAEWHQQPIFTISHAITTITIAVTLMGGLLTLVHRQSLYESQTMANTQAIKENAHAIENLVRSITERGYISPEADKRLRVVETELLSREKQDNDWRQEVRTELREIKTELRRK